jgi:hypothetical protein
MPDFEPKKDRVKDPRIMKAMLIMFCKASGGKVETNG